MRFIIVLLLLLSLASFQSENKVLHQFYWWTHDNADGTPSKCDCDYRGEDLTLYSDSTFIFREQKGRLDPEFAEYKGKWKIDGYERLILTITQSKYFFQKEWATENYYKTYSWKNNRLDDDEHDWRGK